MDAISQRLDEAALLADLRDLMGTTLMLGGRRRGAFSENCSVAIRVSR